LPLGGIIFSVAIVEVVYSSAGRLDKRDLMDRSTLEEAVIFRLDCGEFGLERSF